MGLISIDQVRAEGLDETTADDPRVQLAINTWSSFVERHCRQPFTPKPRAFTLDGNNGDTVFLPWPLLGLKALYINGDFTTPVAPTNYRAYMGLDFPDDRSNPKIQLVSTIASSPASDFFFRRNRQPFTRGKQNQRVVGVFGYCDPGEPIDIISATNASPIVIETATPHGLDGTVTNWVRVDDVGGNTAANYAWQATVIDATHLSLNGSSGNGAFTAGAGTVRTLTVPALIQRAVMKLVMSKFPQLNGSDEAGTPGPAWLEMTDGHQVQYLTPDRFKVKAITIGITKDTEVEQILAMYRAPTRVSSPGTQGLWSEK